jgi:hypothetical protein
MMPHMWQMPTYCECGCGGRVAFKGSYRKRCAPAGTSCDPHGKQKSAHAKWNPITNSKNNAKVQKRALDEVVLRINEMSKDEKALTLEEAIKWAADIMEHVGDGFDTQAVTLEEFLGINGSDQNPDDWGYSLYWGYTSRMLNPGKLEYTLNPGKLNRPVLLWSDNSTITMSDAQSELGFTFHEVHASTLKYNARMVEKALQQRYQHLELGHRLWRCPDKGSKFDKEVDGKVHKVFITFSPLISQMLADGKIKVNK